MSNYAPPTAPMAPPPKKSNALWWVLGGCGTLVLIGIIVVVGFVYWGVNKVQEAVDHPAQTMANLIAAGNPEVEVVSVDEEKGLITFRNKKDGSTVTINLDEAQGGEISFEEKGKGSVSIKTDGDGSSGSLEIKSEEGTAKFGGGAPEELPDWLPNYPGADVEGNFSMKGSKGDAGSFGFTTEDSVEQVINYFEAELKVAGLKVTTSFVRGDGRVSYGIATANNAAKDRKAVVTATASGKGSQVSVSFESKE
ncbi:MAG TPA: hypothetical protein VJH03_14725 [Blastocatellia bacterium]|nr:hypothetical protein [Blastocatellia bacterium]